MDIEEIKEGLKLPGKSRVGLAVALAVDVSQISRLLNGKRHLKVCELPKIREYLYGDPLSLLTDESLAESSPTAKQLLANLEAIRQLLDEADRHDVDAPALILTALREAIETKKSAQWNDENKDAIDQYNQRVAQRGAFGNTTRNY